MLSQHSIVVWRLASVFLSNKLVDLRNWTRSLILVNHTFLHRHSICLNHDVWSEIYISCFLIWRTQTSTISRSNGANHKAQTATSSFFSFDLFSTFDVDQGWTRQTHGNMAWRSRTFLGYYLTWKWTKPTYIDCCIY